MTKSLMPRYSQAALAWITRTKPLNNTEILTQWNNRWSVFSLLGGHVEEGESFRHCLLRELTEELECEVTEINAAAEACTSLRFRELSQSTGLETDYDWQVFHVQLSVRVLEQLPRSCAWVATDRVLARSTVDGQPIGEQVYRVLNALQNTSTLET